MQIESIFHFVICYSYNALFSQSVVFTICKITCEIPGEESSIEWGREGTGGGILLLPSSGKGT